MAKNEKRVTQIKTNTRPPVVAILGHVDHGKTTLLDYIRKTHVAEKEEGGITQHIGAYQIEYKGRKITFIDTPGHEAFSAMRARGGQVSDLAVLIVAADDGVMPQTKESIAHIKAANIPFIVAINKMDMPGANVERVKKELSKEEVFVEGYGGDVVIVPISAKTGQGVDELLEMIDLVADLAELKKEEGKPFEGVVIESRLDKSRGPIASILVKKGVLKYGDTVFTKTASGKVKSLTDSLGSRLIAVEISTPIEVLGFTKVPKVGEIVKSFPEEYKEEGKETKQVLSKTNLPQLSEDEIRLIIKADVMGSLEAITNSLESLKDEDQKIKIFYAETGDISESDVLLAAAIKAIIIGFNVGINSSAERLASEEKVLIRNYKLIYELLEELKEGLHALSEKKVEEEVFGKAEIIALFKIDSTRIAGCRVVEGRINRDDTIVLKRGEKELGRAKIVSMKHRESDINEANVGDEFGLVLEKDLPFAKGDIIFATISSS
ncbi:MAG: translation initiation factor IF-2 [Candidatus Woykebacteria bacterium RBG_13_40_15]|uniref:Translation initiation factor IF-2 n=1 Tax=Candidatus Woykebacteria bacterium RBG_13_40_15 TaxID=1802593 RepID=A0A1G1W903_9BACT|nr:MAG: translation initiation factor IF-2 [Candidatus Woykebacteria bacterium RBG_13_40_15]